MTTAGRRRTAVPAKAPLRARPGACALLAALALTAQAQDAQPPAPATLGDIVVTGYRAPTLQREAADSVTLLTREQIERLDPATGFDLFRQVPGLQIDRLGGPGGPSFVYIRGSDPNHVLVLIDGVRVNDPTNSRGGGVDLSGLDPLQIERIEVLRGAASSVYGADAMGGVINIVTRRGQTGAPRVDLAAGAGGQGYRRLYGRVAGGTRQANFSLGVSTLRDGRERDGAALDLGVVTGTGHLALGPDAALDLDLRHAERDSSSFPDDSGGIRLAQLRTLEQRHARDTSVSLRGTWDLGERVTLSALASHYERREDIDSPGVAPGVRSPIGVPAALSATDFRRDNLLGKAVLHLPRGSELALGVETQREHGMDDTTYTLFGQPIPFAFDLERRTQSAFAELKWQATRDLVVRGGLRHDDVDGIGEHTSPSLGAHYELRSIGGAVKASYSEGFKPPSFFALGLPVALSGNPDLRAEHSRGGSIGYEQRLDDGNATAAVSLFKTRYTDLVTFDNQTNQLVNADNVEVRGAELELDLKLSRALSLHAHFTRLLTHVADADEPLRQRPGKRAGLQVFYTLNERARVSWSTEFVADVFDSSVPTGNLTLPTSVRSDAAFTLQLRKGVSATVGIDNVFDRDNESYVGFVAPGRRVRLDLSAAF